MKINKLLVTSCLTLLAGCNGGSGSTNPAVSYTQLANANRANYVTSIAYSSPANQSDSCKTLESSLASGQIGTESGNNNSSAANLNLPVPPYGVTPNSNDNFPLLSSQNASGDACMQSGIVSNNGSLVGTTYLLNNVSTTEVWTKCVFKSSTTIADNTFQAQATITQGSTTCKYTVNLTLIPNSTASN